MYPTLSLVKFCMLCGLVKRAVIFGRSRSDDQIFGRILGYSTRNYSQLLKNTRKKVTRNADNYVFLRTFSSICTQ